MPQVSPRHIKGSVPNEIQPEAPLAAGLKQMREHSVRHLIVRQNGDVVGMLSDREIVDAAAASLETDAPTAAAFFAKPIAEVMVRPTHFLNEQSDLQEALAAFRDSGMTALPVLRDGETIGVVTHSDLFKVLGDLVAQRHQHSSAGGGFALLANPLVQNLLDLLGQAGI